MRAAVPSAPRDRPSVDSASAQVEALLLRASSRSVPSNSGGESLPRPGPTPATRRAIANAARADTGHKEGDRKEDRDPAGRAHPGLHLWAPSVPPQQSVSALDRLGVWGLEHAGPSRGRAFVSAEVEREHPLGEVAPHDAGNGPQRAQEAEHVGSSGEEPHDLPQGIGDGAAQFFELQVRGGGPSWNRVRDPILCGCSLGSDRRPDPGRVLRTARQPRRDRRLASRVDGGRRTPFLSAAGQDCHDSDGR